MVEGSALAEHRHRLPLLRTARRIEEGRLTIGFIGGSITDPRPTFNWPEPVAAWFVERFPGTRIVVENAAIGATSSDLAVFRAKRDLIDRGCDLVFIEFAVNDHGLESGYRGRTREGLVRKLLADAPDRDILFAHTFSQPMYDDMMAGRVPPSIAEFEVLADHYGVGSTWMGLHALREVQAGRLRWEHWLPDGLHPASRGSRSYGDCVAAFLEQALAPGSVGDGAAARADLPEPLDPLNWEGASTLALDKVRTDGPWSLVRWAHCPWIDQVLYTCAPGACLSFDVEGRGVALGFDFGKLSSDFRWRLDGGEWQDTDRDRPDWAGDRGWFRLTVLADDLRPGSHHVDVEVTHPGEGSTGTNFCLGLIGVIP